MNRENSQSLWGISQLTLRAILIGMAGSLVITASSMYVALKLSALPWPTVFVAVLSMALLKIFGKTNLNEINIAQTGMSAGAMVAGGIAFTIPGLWISGVFEPYTAGSSLGEWFWPKFWPVFFISLAGMIVGSLLCWLLRPRYIEQEKLPYPIGTAAAETLRSGDEGGSKARILFSSLGLAAVFTALRDRIAGFPQNISFTISQVPVGLALSPMAIGIGYIIGLNYTIYWFAGAVFSNVVIQRLGTHWNYFADSGAAGSYNLTAAIGLMVGSGAGILISFLYGLIRHQSKAAKKRDNTTKSRDHQLSTGKTSKMRLSLVILLTVAAAFILTVLAGIPPTASILLMIGVLVATGMSATITGQTGINPMEIFGIIILLAIRLFVAVDTTGAFLIAAIVAVACGYAGDLLNDYRAGSMLQTNPGAQLVAQLFGGLIGTVVASLAVFAIVHQHNYVFGAEGLSAAQAQSVNAMVSGIGDPFVFLVAAVLGCFLYLRRVPAMIIGIGMILPIYLSTAILLGGLIRLVLEKIRRHQSDGGTTGNIVAAGLLGGEGIAGVILAILAMITGM